MKKYFVLLLFISNSLRAQNNADSIKFEMIKATLHFYAGDTAAFHNVKTQVINCHVNDYACLYTFCEQNQLTNVDDKIKKWSAVDCKTQADLMALQSRIFDDLISNEKGYRRQLPGYEEYGSQLEKLIGSFNAPAIDKDFLNDNLMLWIALFTGIFGSLLGLWLITHRSKPTSKGAEATIGAEAYNNDEDLRKLENRMGTLSAALSLKTDAKALESLSARITKMEEWIMAQSGKEKLKSTAVNVPEEKKENVSSTNIYYAKIPDLSDGFSSDSLKTVQNGEQVYEITLKGNKGKYEVSADQEAQRYALNDYSYILSPGCMLDNQPFSGCTIVTTKSGSLFKSTDGWIIENKAVIEFR